MDTSARLLRLLSLLQIRRNWSGAQLADRLDISTRTVRTDINRLRSLGYTVVATPGVAGGYRLGAGAVLPAQLLDDDEAVVVAIGLCTAAGGAVAGIEETAVRALAKLEQVMPARLSRRVHTLQAAMVALPGTATVVRPEVLTAIAAACRDHDRLRLDYVDRHDASSIRTVEPHRMVHAGQRWYLVAFDLDRRDWRSFRVDRLTPRIPTGPRFIPRELPEPDIATYVTRGRMAALWNYRARITLRAPAVAVAPKIPPAVWVLEAVDDQSCILDAGADTPLLLAVYLGALDVDFDVHGAPELVTQLTKLAGRYLRAAQ